MSSTGRNAAGCGELVCAAKVFRNDVTRKSSLRRRVRITASRIEIHTDAENVGYGSKPLVSKADVHRQTAEFHVVLQIPETIPQTHLLETVAGRIAGRVDVAELAAVRGRIQSQQEIRETQKSDACRCSLVIQIGLEASDAAAKANIVVPQHIRNMILDRIDSLWIVDRLTGGCHV